MAISRDAFERAASPDVKRASRPQISLLSFVLGFSLGCTVFLVVGVHTIMHTMCIGSCATNAVVRTRTSDLRVRLEDKPTLALATTLKASATFTKATDGTVSAQVKKPSVCPNRPLHLVLLILSSPTGTLRRNAIRGTWLHDYRSSRLKVTAKFLVGLRSLSRRRIGNLTNEEATFGDMLLLPDLRDSYSNLSTKVLMGLKWAYEGATFDFVVKTDDDSYIRIEKLAAALIKMNCEERLYWGYFMGHAFPELTGKWAETRWFHCPHYLPYAMGGGYVLSRRTVQAIVRFSSRLKLYSNEDVAVSSWLAPYRLVRKHDLRFNVESLSHGCNNGYIISHKERVRMLYEKYTSLLRNKTLCSEEKEIRPAYVYNWTVSPLQCCERLKGLQVLDM